MLKKSGDWRDLLWEEDKVEGNRKGSRGLWVGRKKGRETGQW